MCQEDICSSYYFRLECRYVAFTTDGTVRKLMRKVLLLGQLHIILASETQRMQSKASCEFSKPILQWAQLHANLQTSTKQLQARSRPMNDYPTNCCDCKNYRKWPYPDIEWLLHRTSNSMDTYTERLTTVHLHKINCITRSFGSCEQASKGKLARVCISVLQTESKTTR